jgi:hypothetical protein
MAGMSCGPSGTSWGIRSAASALPVPANDRTAPFSAFGPKG